MQSPVTLNIDAATDVRIRKAFAYWDSVRQGRAMPSRADIDPLDLRFCLGWVCLVDVVPGTARRYRFRLDGSQLVELTGFDLTGRYVDDIEDVAYREFVQGLYDGVVDARAPMVVRHSEQWKSQGFLTESVTLPLSNDGVLVTGLMDVLIPKQVSAIRTHTAIRSPANGADMRLR